MLKIDKKLLKSDFGKAAKSYGENAKLQKQVATILVQKAKGIIPENAYILDAGCGTGFIAEEANNFWDILQVDISKEMVEQASSYGQAQICDIENLPLEQGSFDGVVSSLALQWCDATKVAGEFHRVLKNGGNIVISTLGKNNLQDIKSLFEDVTGQNRFNDYLPKENLKDIFEKAGFSDVKIESETLIYQYNSLKNMLKSIREIGASNKSQTRKKTISKAEFKELERRFNGVASWEILYIKAKK